MLSNTLRNAAKRLINVANVLDKAPEIKRAVEKIIKGEEEPKPKIRRSRVKVPEPVVCPDFVEPEPVEIKPEEPKTVAPVIEEKPKKRRGRKPLSPEEKRERRRAAYQRYMAKNRDKVLEYQARYRAQRREAKEEAERKREERRLLAMKGSQAEDGLALLKLPGALREFHDALKKSKGNMREVIIDFLDVREEQEISKVAQHLKSHANEYALFYGERKIMTNEDRLKELDP